MSTYTDSQENKLRKVLNEMELYERKLSQLLREMKKLAQNQINLEVLRTSCLQRLPSYVQ